jgi:hypothetical protein
MSHRLKQQRDVQLADLRARLQDSVEHPAYGGNTGAQQALEEQMRVLDLIFRRGITEGEGVYKDTVAHFGLALRAQDQFRKTMQTASVLKDRERNTQK